MRAWGLWPDPGEKLLCQATSNFQNEPNPQGTEEGLSSLRYSETQPLKQKLPVARHWGSTYPSVSWEQEAISGIKRGKSCGATGTSFTAGRRAKWYSLAGSYKTKHNCTIQQSHSLLFSQSSWKFISTQKPALDVYSIFIHNRQTWKEPRCPLVGEWINSGITGPWNVTQH